MLWFLDFGAVGRLSPVMLESMQEMAIGFQLNDPVILARAAGRASPAATKVGDSRALEADIGLVLAEGVGSGSFDPQAMSLMLDIMAAPRPRGAGRDDRALPRCSRSKGPCARSTRRSTSPARPPTCFPSSPTSSTT